MSAFQDGVGLRIANCHESGLDSAGLEQLLEFNANEFSAIVVDAMKWTGMSTEPCGVQSDGDDVFDALDADDLWGMFFRNQTPAADSVSAEVVEGEIPMICENVDEMSQEDGSELSESFNNGEQFQFSNSAAGLRVQELARAEGERLLALHGHGTKLVFRGIGADVKRN